MANFSPISNMTSRLERKRPSVKKHSCLHHQKRSDAEPPAPNKQKTKARDEQKPHHRNPVYVASPTSVSSSASSSGFVSRSNATTTPLSLGLSDTECRDAETSCRQNARTTCKQDAQTSTPINIPSVKRVRVKSAAKTTDEFAKSGVEMRSIGIQAGHNIGQAKSMPNLNWIGFVLGDMLRCDVALASLTLHMHSVVFFLSAAQSTF